MNSIRYTEGQVSTISGSSDSTVTCDPCCRYEVTSSMSCKFLFLVTVLLVCYTLPVVEVLISLIKIVLFSLVTVLLECLWFV